MRQVILSTFLLALAPFIEVGEAQEPKPDADGWFSLFDGKSLAGWKAAEFPQAFKVEDGVISAGATPSEAIGMNPLVERSEPTSDPCKPPSRQRQRPASTMPGKARD